MSARATALPLPVFFALSWVAIGVHVAFAAPTPLGTGSRAVTSTRTAFNDEGAARLLEVHPRQAGSSALVAGSVRAYADARRLLARGKPAAALKALAKGSGGLLDDREALLRGDALLALADPKGAKEAYLEAIRKSEIKAVSIAAARGLVGVLGLLKERDQQLRYVDALLESSNVARKAGLLVQRAMLLRDLGRAQEAAEVAWRVVREFPSAKASIQANTLVKEIGERGVKVPATSDRIELARIKNLVQSGDYKRAEIEIVKLEDSRPKLKRALDLERADLFHRRRMKSEEYDLLFKLYREGGFEGDEGAEGLWRLGKAAMGRDDNESAIRFFDEVAAKFPEDPLAGEAQYLASWIPYNEARYDEATDRMLRFAATYRGSPNRAEALWFAGWSAYLANKDGLARRALEQLLEEHPTSDLRPQARYWVGRIRQRAGEEEPARAAYREILAQSPFSYWGFWAMARLDELGERVVLEPRPPTTIAPLAKVIAILGPQRPRGIDRAIALHSVDLTNDALDELTAANSYFRGIKDTEGRTMIADLLSTLGAHYLAFLIGSSIAQDGADLVSGKPHAWRAWRHAYPAAFEKEVSLASRAHAVDEHLILSIMRTESSFRTNVRSPAGAHGLMQVMPGTAAQIGKRIKDGRAHAARFKSPGSNVWLGTWYLGRLLVRYGGQMAPAIGAYNAGPAAMDKWVSEHGGLDLDEFVERIPYRETRRYVRRVLETYMIYRRLNGAPLLDFKGKVRDMLVPEGSVEF